MMFGVVVVVEVEVKEEDGVDDDDEKDDNDSKCGFAFCFRGLLSSFSRAPLTPTAHTGVVHLQWQRRRVLGSRNKPRNLCACFAMVHITHWFPDCWNSGAYRINLRADCGAGVVITIFLVTHCTCNVVAVTGWLAVVLSTSCCHPLSFVWFREREHFSCVCGGVS